MYQIQGVKQSTCILHATADAGPFIKDTMGIQGCWLHDAAEKKPCTEMLKQTFEAWETGNRPGNILCILLCVPLRFGPWPRGPERAYIDRCDEHNLLQL